METNPTTWVELADRYGVSLVMLVFVSGLLVTGLYAVYKHFLIPTRDRELRFIDDVSKRDLEGREATREALQAVASGISAIEGYTKSLDDKQTAVKQSLEVHHQFVQQALKKTE